MLQYALAFAASIAMFGCHVTGRFDETLSQSRKAMPTIGEVVRGDLALTVDDTGYFRLAHGKRCPARFVDTMVDRTVITKGPNLATFVVGVVASSLGAIAMINAGSSEEPLGSPLLYGGGVLLAGGLGLAIGPWLGNSTRIEAHPESARPMPGASTTIACGDIPVEAGNAFVRVDRFDGVTTVERGRVADSPFTWADAFDLRNKRDWVVEAKLDNEPSVKLALDGQMLLRVRDSYLRGLGIDASVQPMDKVPSVIVAPPVITRRNDHGTPTARIQLSTSNHGPGEAWQVRLITSSPLPELDGRIVYLGHLPAGKTHEVVLSVPISHATDSALVSSELELSVLAVDAHSTTSSHPARYVGLVLSEIPVELQDSVTP